MSLLWLKNVPWATILANAPGIVDGAKRLASAMRNKPAASDEVSGPLPADDPAARLHKVEQQQRAAADLLRSLADQNAQMAEALVVLRQRAKLHLRIAVVALLVALGTLLWNIFH
jgi:hypothetical protein